MICLVCFTSSARNHFATSLFGTVLSTTLTVKVRVMALQAPVANCTILTLQHNSHSTGNTEPLINAVVNCFWRTPKSAVINELSIMKPITIVKRLEFSQIERDFYQRQADKCKESIRLHFAKVNRDAKMADLSHTTRLIASIWRLNCVKHAAIRKFAVINFS